VSPGLAPHLALGTPLLISLGPFQLETPLGRGGMAAVWRAHHREYGSPVAVKVLVGDGVRNPLFFKTFRSEARGAAGLDHPGIVSVFDHGLTSPADADASEGVLAAGSPYLVMEIAGPGTLAPHKGQLPWPELRAVLLGLLDALAHAHARGVVHRDIKPANVLVGNDGTVKLTDFGLVHAFTADGAGATGAEFMGTPAYMAPEQLEVRWRDFGPWTDLYALGCLGWALATGAPPFGTHLSSEQALTAHMKLPLPPLLPVMPVPAGFEGWLRRLLAREPRQRFQRAADAAWALGSLGKAEVASALLAPASGRVRAAEPHTVILPDAATQAVEPEAANTELMETTAPPRRAPATRPGAQPYGHPGMPPTPDDWRRGATQGNDAWIAGVGLGVYGSRRVPLVGRDAERDLLWKSLREAQTSRSPRVLLLEGAAGCGKTRLARWVAERAHELGAATVLVATHGALAGPSHGLAPMLARFGRFDGLEGRQARRRVARLLAERGRFAEDEIDAVTALLAPSGARQRVRFRNPEERFLALRRLLAVIAQERTVVLVLDDLHFGVETLSFLNHLLASDVPCPLLAVGTVRDDLLAERPAEAALVGDLVARPEVRPLYVGPLPEEHRAGLVRGLLGLEGALAEAVERRTAGNPLFAVELVGDWVQRGLLVATDSGFALRDGADAHLPDDLHAVWQERVERFLAGRSRHDGQALELAGVLGTVVHAWEWEQVVGLAELAPSKTLIDDLVNRRLARLDGEGVFDQLRFAHAMLPETLIRRAAEAGRLEEHHSACAAMLAGRRDTDSVVRRGRHLFAAGRRRAALQPLSEAIAALLSSGDLPRAGSLLTLYEDAVARTKRLEGHPAALRAKVLRARVGRLKGELKDAAALARTAMEAVVGREGPEAQAVYRDALIELGNCRVHMGDLAEARIHLSEALRLSSRASDSAAIALCRRQLAYVRMSEGELVGATREARSSIFAAEEGGDSAEVAQGYQILSRCLLLQGKPEEAAFTLEEARLRFERVGARWGVATALNSLGEIAREQGDAERAERAYRDAANRYAAIGSGDGVYPRANLGLLLVELGRWREALDVLLPLRQEVAAQRRGTMEAAVAVSLLAPLAAQGRWDEVDLFVLRGAALLEETGFVEPDLARKASLAGDLALEGGQEERARAAWEIARDQWAALGRDEERDIVEAKLVALDA